MKKFRFTPRTMAVLGILVALEVVIAQYGTFRPTQSLKLSLDFAPIVLAGALFGPLPAMIIGILADILGAFLFPVGPYFPGFTVTAALTGLLYGAALHDRETWPRILLAVGVQQWIISLWINSFWLKLLYGMPYLPTVLGRVLQCAILTAVQLVLIPVLLRALRAVKKRAKL